jgi:uncharacterized protein (TIGR03067 family)
MRVIALLIWACVAVACVPFVTAGDAEKSETEVDGTWKLIKYIENGKPREEIVKQNYLIVRKHGVQEITKDGKPFSKTKFKVDPSKTPKHIDFLSDKGALGAYEIKGREMRLAILADPKKQKTERPGDLKEAEGNIIAVYERVKDK